MFTNETMTKVNNHRFRARKPLNLTKVGVAKHKVGVSNLNVGGTAAGPNCIGNSARAGVSQSRLTPSCASQGHLTPYSASQIRLIPSVVSQSRLTLMPCGASQSRVTPSGVSKSRLTPSSASQGRLTPSAVSQSRLTPSGCVRLKNA